MLGFPGKRIPRRTDIWPRAWRRHPLGLFAAVLIVVLLTWKRTENPKPFGTDQERYDGKVFTCIHVVDGDTLDIDAPDGMRASTRIRLWGVDTPETVKPNTPVMYFGREASDYVKSRVQNKKVRVVLAPQRTRDKYERLLAYIYPTDSDAMLNEDIIANGYGYADSRFPHVWKARFTTLETRARKAKLGLWKDITPDQMPDWRQRIEQHNTKTPSPTNSPSNNHKRRTALN